MNNSNLRIVDIMEVKSSNGVGVVLGYGCGESHRYHVVHNEEYIELLETIISGDEYICFNSLYSFSDVSQSSKILKDFDYLLQNTWDADACLYVQNSEKGDNSILSIFIDSEGIHLMSEYDILETSQDLRLITDKYLEGIAA